MRSLGNEIPSCAVSVVWERQEPLLLIGDDTGNSSVFSEMTSSANDTRRGRGWVTGVTVSGKHDAGTCHGGAPDDGIESRR